ncbi:hypothetical protein E1A91_A13G107600v1 [Gossypium mustelinum]|uniref:O-fucosyltransferase family protein n=1 Tax=Gossypium mustelinum TaxID=34275 RepID=A0A5D2WH67_GOSMU|nr:hypothetical protein E1A91_A13G107600v1 [Gossypium mustelinum]
MKTVAAKQPSSLACIKFWVVVTLIMLLILWVFAMQLATPDDKIMVPKSAFYIPYDFPPQRVCKNNGYLIISPNRGLTQKGLGVADMVAIARYLNVTLIVPKFAYGTYWNDTSKFEDFFYVNHFITSLRDEVKILKESFLRYKSMKFCSLRFTKPVEETGRKIVNILREKGPFFVLHLRYEKDILAFTICKQGLTKEEAEDVKQMKYSQDGWRHKPIASNKKRKHGLCPLTPEETPLVLQALDIDENITIYIAAEEIYNKEKRMADLEATYPNLVTPMDYIVAIESDIFMPTFVGNIALAPTISLDRKLLFSLIVEYKNGTLLWDEFSLLVKKIHEDRTGKPAKRKENPDHARQEDSFYSNPQECLPTFACTIN